MTSVPSPARCSHAGAEGTAGSGRSRPRDRSAAPSRDVAVTCDLGSWGGWQRLLRRPVSESGRLRHGNGAQGRGDRRRTREATSPAAMHRPLGPPSANVIASCSVIARPLTVAFSTASGGRTARAVSIPSNRPGRGCAEPEALYHRSARTRPSCVSPRRGSLRPGPALIIGSSR